MKNIHLLPTDKPSRLFLKENTLLLNNQYTLQEVFPKGKCQHIYITSDEEIKEGDWCLDYDKDLLKYDETKHNMLFHNVCKKIILTTDDQLIKDGIQSIDDEFLEWFVKNPSCEEVKTKNYFEKFGEMDSIKYKIIFQKEDLKTNKIC